MAEQSSRAAACASAGTAQNAFGLRAAFPTAYFRDATGRVRGGCAFTIMRLMGHSTVTISQRYVYPSPEALELAYERMTAMNLRRLPTNPHGGSGR